MTSTPLSEPALLVLTVLASGPQHGYGLIGEVAQVSGGRLQLGTGSLYAILDRLRQAGLIELDREEVVRSRLRRYYRLTGLGAQELAAESERLRRTADAADKGLRRLRLGGAS
ncbi:PadR family transcriptional regulator [Plantactinospora soyae]|uniref:DNA-binding PadR family transcriptional regulator n=1 Tax=Plantactinospora soyae TaxID=1544732 RepID=A0A927MHZ0_9ACTN|nr:helix-turn-helix transcriptional regulator [Plantactinospora soyae]MBE1492008.1 DNA-binding PadR family transcriptional regulator [Plantactinospora soyae]